MKRQSLSLLLVAALTACSSVGSAVPSASDQQQRVWSFKVNADPTFAFTKAYVQQHPLPALPPPTFGTNYCPAALSLTPQYSNCSTNDPTFQNWTFSLYFPSSGSGGIFAFGLFHQTYAFLPHPTLALCAKIYLSSLAQAASGVWGALAVTTGIWGKLATNPEIEALYLDYAAGEIGAAAFLTAVFALMPSTVLLQILSAAIAAGVVVSAMTVITEIDECVVTGFVTSAGP